jgi:hypothetical protein
VNPLKKTGENCERHLSNEILDWEKGFKNFRTGYQVSGIDVDYPKCQGPCSFKPYEFIDEESGLSEQCGIVCRHRDNVTGETTDNDNDLLLLDTRSYKYKGTTRYYGWRGSTHGHDRYNSTMSIPGPRSRGMTLTLAGWCSTFFFLMLFTTCCSHRVLPYKRKVGVSGRANISCVACLQSCSATAGLQLQGSAVRESRGAARGEHGGAG